MAKLISKTYGDALLELAVEENKVDEISEEIASLGQIMDENPDFERLINNPRIDIEDKLNVVETVFRGRTSDEVTGFILTVVSKGRFSEIRSILEYFTAQVEALKGIGTAYVTTPIPLSEQEKKQIEDRLLATTTYKSMLRHYDTDESLIGGMQIRIGDRVVDSSIRTKITNLKHSLMNTMLD